LRHVIPLNLLR